MPNVSIVMPYWNRPLQLDRTLKSIQRQQVANLEVIIVPDLRKRMKQWMNPAPLWNEGIRRARGEVLVLQSPECEHITENTIEGLCKFHGSSSANLASVMALKEDSTWDKWYCHSEFRRKPWFFCGAIHRSAVEAISGFNESFTGYGGEDVDFAKRLEDIGVRFVWRDDILVHHQWHEYTGAIGL